MSEYKINDDINKFLLELGFSAKHTGFTFLRDCLKMVAEQGGVVDFLTKVLYPTIAQKYKTAVPNVERNIRNAIEVAWASDGKIKEIFNRSKKRPTNRELIAILGDKVVLVLDNAS